jgi:hypothetical protein
MIGLPEFLIVLGVFALVATFVWTIHQILSAADRAEDPAAKAKA